MNTTQTAGLSIGQQIAKQINAQAFFMMGSNLRATTERGLRFNVRGSRFANFVEINLDYSDTYTVRFLKFSPSKLTEKLILEREGVYADGIKQVLEENLKLRLSL